MKTKLFFTFFLGLIFSFTQAQPFFNVKNDFFIFEDPFAEPACDEAINAQDCWNSPEIIIKTDYTTNASQDPANTINQASWRYIYFDVFQLNPDGTETFELSIAKPPSKFLDEQTCSLDPSDLEINNVSAGTKVIRLRVQYTMNNVAYLVGLVVNRNNVEMCSTEDLESEVNFECDLGFVTCLTYSPCQASVDLFGMTEFFNFPPFEPFCVTTINIAIAGGSGDYSINWIATTGQMGTSQQPSFSHNCEESVWLETVRVVDNETGCVYFWERNGEMLIAPPNNEVSDFNTIKINTETEGFKVYPNIISPFSEITFDYFLEDIGRVSIDLIDQNGKTVQTIRDQIATEKGNHTIISTIEVPTGFYFIKFSVDGLVKNTARLSVVK